MAFALVAFLWLSRRALTLTVPVGCLALPQNSRIGTTTSAGTNLFHDLVPLIAPVTAHEPPVQRGVPSLGT